MSVKFTDKVYDKMKKCMEAHCMLSPGEAIIACVSGGCDSVALLCLLKNFIEEEKENRKLICAHFDHQLRGEESDGDRLFTEELCKTLEIEFCCESKDVQSYCRDKKISLETGARELRYNFFYRTAEKYGGKIAVAHNSNDKVETVLLNIARGTGTHGLKGISYTRGNIIRPLLDIERSELEAYLSENNISYRTDSTNNEAFCKRNKIRLDILPFLRETLAEDIDSKLLRLSHLATEDNHYISEVAHKLFVENVKCDGKTVVVDYLKINSAHKAVLKRVAMEILCVFYEGGAGITLTAVEDLTNALESKNAGFAGEVGKGINVRVYHDRMVVSEEASNEDSVLGNIFFSESEVDLSKIRKCGNMIAAFDKESLDSFCKEKGASWEIRCRNEGDYFTPLGSKGGKLLKKFFIDSKVPADIRNCLPLLVVGNEVLWIPGVRRSNVAPIGKKTKDAIFFEYRK